MKTPRVICALTLCCLLGGLAACSADDDVTSPVTDTSTVSHSLGSGVGNDQAGGLSQNGDYWEAETLDALGTLLGSADGYAFYYAPDSLPAGLEFTGASVDAFGAGTNLHWKTSGGKNVVMFELRADQPLTGQGFSEMVVDDRTYYYSQPESEAGDPYFAWMEDENIVINVHPGEPITPEVVRKYCRVRKVEFNAGKSHVGLGTDRALVVSLEKVKAITRDNPDIKYHLKASSSPEGLLVP